MRSSARRMESESRRRWWTSSGELAEIGTAHAYMLKRVSLREMNIIAMRLGPGKHLKGKTLLGGVVKPEEFDYFHEVRLNVLYTSTWNSSLINLSSLYTVKSPGVAPAAIWTVQPSRSLMPFASTDTSQVFSLETALASHPC